MTKIMIEVESKLEWAAVRSDSGGIWVAECEPLGLVMEGNTLGELLSVIGEACGALFTDLLEDGELEAFLEARGWRADGLPDGPVEDEFEFTVPWYLVSEGEFTIPWYLMSEGGRSGTERRPH